MPLKKWLINTGWGSSIKLYGKCLTLRTGCFPVGQVKYVFSMFYLACQVSINSHWAGYRTSGFSPRFSETRAAPYILWHPKAFLRSARCASGVSSEPRRSTETHVHTLSEPFGILQTIKTFMSAVYLPLLQEEKMPAEQMLHAEDLKQEGGQSWKLSTNFGSLRLGLTIRFGLFWCRTVSVSEFALLVLRELKCNFFIIIIS